MICSSYLVNSEVKLITKGADMDEQQDVITPSKDERNWAMFCHLSALVGFIIPLGSILGPLVLWLMKKDEMPMVAEHGRKALNFQLTMLLAYIVCFMLLFVVVGVILLPIVCIFAFIMVVIAAIKASDGKSFDYPLSINFVK